MAKTGVTSFRMLLDESFDSWTQLGVATQPAWRLFSPEGGFILGAHGSIDHSAVLEVAATF